MPKRKLEAFKAKIKKKMHKLQQQIEDFSDGESSSTDSSDHTSFSSQPEYPASPNGDIEVDQDRSVEILGDNPTNKNTEGPEIATDLAIRWEAYLSSGLDKDLRKNLL